MKGSSIVNQFNSVLAIHRTESSPHRAERVEAPMPIVSLTAAMVGRTLCSRTSHTPTEVGGVVQCGIVAQECVPTSMSLNADSFRLGQEA